MFSERSLLCIIEDSLFGLAHLQENNMVHADLRPEHISVPTKKGQNFKLLDRLGDPSPPSQVQLNNFKAGKDLYISPSVFQTICAKQRKLKHNPFKSDIFGLGMIILEAGLLDSVQSVYNREYGQIDENALVELVERFFQRFPSNFILQELILVMLEFSEDLRQEPIKLLQTLRLLKQVETQNLPSHADNVQSKNFAPSGFLRKLNFTENSFEIKESLLANLSLLYAPSSTQKSSRENSLKKSLVEMLRNRTSHNLSIKNSMLTELKEDQALEDQESRRGNSLMEYGMGGVSSLSGRPTHGTLDPGRDTARSDVQFVESNASKRVNLNSITHTNKEFEEFDIGVQKMINFYKQNSGTSESKKQDIGAESLMGRSKLTPISEELVNKSSNESVQTAKHGEAEGFKKEGDLTHVVSKHQTQDSVFKQIHIQKKKLESESEKKVIVEMDKDIYSGDLHLLYEGDIERKCGPKALRVIIQPVTRSSSIRTQNRVYTQNKSPQIIQNNLVHGTLKKTPMTGSNTQIKVLRQNPKASTTSWVPRHSVSYSQKPTTQRSSKIIIQSNKRPSIKVISSSARNSSLGNSRIRAKDSKENIPALRQSKSNIRATSLVRNPSQKNQIYRGPLQSSSTRNSIHEQTAKNIRYSNNTVVRFSNVQKMPVTSVKKIESQTPKVIHKQGRYSLAVQDKPTLKTSQTSTRYSSNPQRKSPQNPHNKKYYKHAHNQPRELQKPHKHSRPRPKSGRQINRDPETSTESEAFPKHASSI